MTLAERYSFGDREHVALRMLPCQSSRLASTTRHDFLCALHPTEYHDLRALEANTRAVKAAVNFGSTDFAGVEKFVESYKPRWDLYTGVATRNANGRKLEDCQSLYTLFADLDFKESGEDDARARLAAFPLPPSIVVASGGGLHCYWLLQEPLALQNGGAVRAKQLLKALATTLGADQNAAEPARILRVPDSLNYKYTPPRLVVVDICDPSIRYPLADLVAIIGPLPDAESQPATTVPHEVPVAERVRQAREWLTHQQPAREGQGGDNHTFVICCSVVIGHDLPADVAFTVLTDWNAGCDPPWSARELRAKIEHAEHYGTGVRGEKLRLILNPNDPLPSARTLVARAHTVDGISALRQQHGVFYAYDPRTGVYHDRDEPAMRAELYRFLEHAYRWTNAQEPELLPFQPTKSKVENVLDALRAVCNLPTTQAAPCWLDGRPMPDPLDLLACPNGLLHIPTRTLVPATPHFFTLNGIDFPFDPQAPTPTRWLTFLRQLWPDDAESIAALQEFFGYTLTPDTRFQKMLLIVGPKRSGKGVTGRVHRHLVGDRNTCSPTLASFGDQFGKQVLIGKTLAIISDARIGGRIDTASVAEALLSISGEDSQTVQRKFLPDWSGKLLARFLLLANELPKIGDVSGALASRFVILVLQKSFYGMEDLGLYDRLVPELPGILTWALEGRDRLYARGWFVQPQSAKDLIQELADLASPEATFLREYTRTDKGATVSQKDLFAAWRQWCIENGRDHAGTVQTFSRNVRTALPWITVTKQGARGKQERHWEGLRLEMPGTGERPDRGKLSGW